jgi:NADH dehydrogenase FAD-containing subunit
MKQKRNMTSIETASRRPRVVIIGAGFGGLSAAKQLARVPFDVTIVDRHNYHLFQPLLYQVATAGLSPGDIASPIRGILHRQKNANVILAMVSGVDLSCKEVMAEGRRIPYDYLIVATGAEHAYFGHDWSTYAPGLKTTAARRSLEQLGVEVRLGVGVTDCDCTGVSLGQERLQTRTIIWAAGVKASPAADWLNAECDRAGRVKVQGDLSVPGHPNIFVIGDAAAATGPDRKPLPGVAPVAKQQGWYVANLLMARAKGKTLPAFRYRDLGSMATIGRKSAVAQIGVFKVSGLPAWLLWSLAHIYFLIGFRNRLAVAMNWCWNYVTFQRGTRLITGISGSRIEDVLPAVMIAPPTAADAGDPVSGREASIPSGAKTVPSAEPATCVT